MTGPSKKAIEAADLALIHNLGVGNWVDAGDAFYVLRAAHDPALGLDRSVCLRDVVEALRWYGQPQVDGQPLGEPNHIAAAYADFVEREFGGGA